MVEKFLSRLRFAETRRNPIFTGIDISEEAAKILTRELDKETLAKVLEIFRPLPALYRRPLQRLQARAEAPIVKKNTGFVLYPDAAFPFYNYALPSAFNPDNKIAGECGTITAFFFNDLEKSGLFCVLTSHGISLNVAEGSSPLFFADISASHVFAMFGMGKRLGREKPAVIFDSSFGAIVSESDNSGYVVRRTDALDEVRDRLFSTNPHTIQGWADGELLDGGRCPVFGEPYAYGPESYILGLSPDGEFKYGLGFAEQNGGEPFITLGHPIGNRQEIYWQRKEGGIASMMSDSLGAKASNDPARKKEIESLLYATERFQFENSIKPRFIF